MQVLNKLISVSRTTEVDAVSNRIISEFNKNDWSTDTHLTGIFNQLTPASDNLTKAINRIKAESILEEKDEVRDTKIRAINYLILGFMYHPDATISSAAKQINSIFEHYGVSVTNDSYSTESSLIESLLVDFSSADIQPAIAALPGLSDLITELRTAQTDFQDAKVIYEEEKAKEGTEKTATILKKDVTSIINNNLVVYLRAMIQVDEPTYGDFTRTVAEIIDDNNSLVKKRNN